MREYSDIKVIVENVARQYSKDIFNGRPFDWNKYEELQQELYVEAYSILKTNPDASDGLLYKSLYNKSSKLFHKDMDRLTSTVLVGEDRVMESIGGSVEGITLTDEDLTEELMSMTDQILSHLPDGSDIKTYVIAKLCYSEVLDKDQYGIDFSGYSEDEYVSIDHYILQVILGFSYSSSRGGGPGSFKGKKMDIRQDIISILGQEYLYEMYFDVTVETEELIYNKSIRAYSEESALIKAKREIVRKNGVDIDESGSSVLRISVVLK